MVDLLVLFLEVFIIFLTSQYIFKAFFLLLYITVRSRRLAVFILSLFFLPGVVVHELSHLLTAEVLRVKTHGIEFIPELSEGKLKMGSVLVEDSDFFRQFLIGVAPVVSGVLFLVSLFFLVTPYISLQTIFSSIFTFLLSLFFLYIIFVVANTMFSSKKDIDGAVELFILVMVVLLMGFILKIDWGKYVISFLDKKETREILENGILFLFVPLTLNLLSAISSSLILRKKGIQISR